MSYCRLSYANNLNFTHSVVLELQFFILDHYKWLLSEKFKYLF